MKSQVTPSQRIGSLPFRDLRLISSSLTEVLLRTTEYERSSTCGTPDTVQDLTTLFD